LRYLLNQFFFAGSRNQKSYSTPSIGALSMLILVEEFQLQYNRPTDVKCWPRHPLRKQLFYAFNLSKKHKKTKKKSKKRNKKKYLEWGVSESIVICE